jgi:hypothetical protein
MFLTAVSLAGLGAVIALGRSMLPDNAEVGGSIPPSPTRDLNFSDRSAI